MTDDIQSSSRSDGDLRVDFARLEGKVDVVITRHDVRIEALQVGHDDHEARLRVQEAREYVTPKGLWAALLGVMTVVSGVIVLINFLDAQIF